MPERPSELVRAGRLGTWLLLAGLAACITGCSDSATGDYRTYDGGSTQDSTQLPGENEAISDSRAGGTEAAAPDESSEHQVATAEAGVEVAAATSGETVPAEPTESETTEESAATVAEETTAANPSTDTGDVAQGDDGTGASSGEPVLPAPAQVAVLVEDREFKTEGPEGALRISYDDFDLLKILNMDPVTPDAPNLLPHWLKDLDGKRVRVRGFMYPPFQETDIPVFVLARDNQICCFGRNPKVYDLVKVAMRRGTTTHYIQGRPFDVVGVFHIRPEVEDGELYRLYEIDDAVVIE